MRKLSLVLAATLATTALGVVTAAPAQAKPPKPRAELVAKGPTATYASGTVAVAVTVKNKGNKKARKTQTGFFLSLDGTKSAGDADLGTLPTGRLKPKSKTSVSGALPLPAGLQPGTYRLIACADALGVVKERKEQNNCKASRTTVTLPGGPPPPGKVTISAIATTGGTVAASGVTGGSCTGTFCTLTSGAGTVTFTPTPSDGYRFGAWSGCAGFTGTTAITFTNPTASMDCTATFIRQVTISWTVVGLLPLGGLAGSVDGVPTHGNCTATDPITGTGSCVVDAGVGTVTLTASPLLPVPPFSGWSGAMCDGTPTGNVMVFTGPTTDKACTATFAL